MCGSLLDPEHAINPTLNHLYHHEADPASIVEYIFVILNWACESVWYRIIQVHDRSLGLGNYDTRSVDLRSMLSYDQFNMVVLVRSRETDLGTIFYRG